MKNLFKVALFSLALLAAPAASYAQVGDMIGGNGGLASGQAGYALGTNIYNAINPDSPLPMTGGNVVPNTFYNMGAGQSLGEAESNAATSNSGLSPYADPAPWSPPPADPYAQVPYYSAPASNPVAVSSTPEPSYTPPPINFFSGTESVSRGGCQADACSAQ